MAEDDWDLYAIVRSCSCTSSSAINASNTSQNGNFENPLDCLAMLTFDDDKQDGPFSFPNLVKPSNNGCQELQDSYKPFVTINSTTNGHQSNIPTSSISDFGGFSGQNQPQLAQQQQQQLHHHHQPPPPPPPPPPPSPPSTNIPFNLRFNNSQQQQSQHAQQQNQRRQLHQQGSQRPEASTFVLPLRTTQSPAPSRSRKKKSHQKREVMHVTAENLCNDVWAWRKYGQKPIKGSPYPRNYYRCSSSKGCAARKQVERSNTDPNMFIVSYTGDHTHPRPTHRNSLAGSTRNKFSTSSGIQKPVAEFANKESTELASGEKGSPHSAASLSPTTPLSAPIDHEAAVDQNIKTEAELDSHGIMESEDEGDGDDYDEDDDDILIPNMAFNEDLIKDLQELGRCPNFGDKFSCWSVGSSAAEAGAAAVGD